MALVFRTRSTWGEANGTLVLDIDPTTHPAWTGGGQKILDRDGRVGKFVAKFEGFLVILKRQFRRVPLIKLLQKKLNLIIILKTLLIYF